jgi:hypothetical protein
MHQPFTSQPLQQSMVAEEGQLQRLRKLHPVYQILVRIHVATCCPDGRGTSMHAFDTTCQRHLTALRHRRSAASSFAARLT